MDMKNHCGQHRIGGDVISRPGYPNLEKSETIFEPAAYMMTRSVSSETKQQQSRAVIRVYMQSVTAWVFSIRDANRVRPAVGQSRGLPRGVAYEG